MRLGNQNRESMRSERIIVAEQSRDPALVVMPTGTGKTAVLMLTPYFRRSIRALVITPSKLVRNQVYEQFRSLAVLKQAEVVPGSLTGPNVFELKTQIRSIEEWEALRAFDVVVATPNGVSPAYEDIPQPPNDLFDLLLIDEAHHSPALTWKAILDCFPTADKVLFTATPFRRDSREIKGRFIYNYPIRAAFDEKVFGTVRFCPVQPKANESNDIAIAKATQKVFHADKKAGFRHAVMVRTSQIKRAEELALLYADHTSLRLQAISSQHNYSHVVRTIEKLRNAELDGIICVDMMSEGFDFPNLKIAAIHSPHKSLAVTLQFIGRFARTNAPDIGEAKFLAVPQEIEGELRVLYDEKAVWQEIILDLQHSQVAQEKETREAIDTFDEPQISEFTAEDLSLYSLRPYSHVKVFRVNSDNLDITTAVSLPRPFRVIFQQVSNELSTAVIVVNETEQPKWTDIPAFNRSEFDLFVVYYHAESRLLFINASRKSVSLYESIADKYTGGDHKILPLYQINRSLHELQDAEFFSVGMKNRVAHSQNESYQTKAGPRANRAISRTDGKLFHCGHLFGKGVVNGEKVTIGFSSASKVWSNKHLQIPALIAWCRRLASRFANETPLPKFDGLENLPIGEKLTRLPEGIILAEWPPSVFEHHTDLVFSNRAGSTSTCPLFEAELSLLRGECNQEQLVIRLEAGKFSFPIRFSLSNRRFFDCPDLGLETPLISIKGHEHNLLAYLNNHAITFLTATYAVIRGDEIVRFSTSELQPLDSNCLIVENWASNNVDICCEFKSKNSKPRSKHISIHDFLAKSLDDEKYLAVLYDHRVNEAADFVTIEESNEKIVIRFYHCKSSGGPKPGNRVDDLYEVCGQGIKSLHFVENEPDLLKHIRIRATSGSRFVRGNFQKVKKAFDRGFATGFEYEVCLVQPGISKKALQKKMGEVLAATRDHFARSGVARFTALVSE